MNSALQQNCFLFIDYRRCKDWSTLEICKNAHRVACCRFFLDQNLAVKQSGNRVSSATSGFVTDPKAFLFLENKNTLVRINFKMKVTGIFFWEWQKFLIILWRDLHYTKVPGILNNFGVDLPQSWQEENVKIKWESQNKRRDTAVPTCGFPSLAHGTK